MMPSSMNSQSKHYLSRMLSGNSNGTTVNGNGGTKTNLKRANEELRSHILKLKSDLESERTKSKQTHREKVADVKRMRDEIERENQLLLQSAAFKMNTFKEIEIKKLRESLTRDKDIEIKQIIKFKDEEIRTLQRCMQEEKELALRNAEEKYNEQFSSRSNRSYNDENTRRFRHEIFELKKSKDILEDTCKQHVIGINEKNDIIKQLKSEHERELQRILREARRENSRSISEMQTLKKSLNEKTAEANKMSLYAERISGEKEELLSEKIRQDRLNITAERSLLSMSNLNDSRPLSPRMDKDKVLHSKNAELRRQLDAASKKMKQMEKENNNLTLSSLGLLSSDVVTPSATDKRVKDLKRRNTELVQIARKLEDKAKQVQLEMNSTKAQNEAAKENTASISSLKKSFAMQRAKDLAEHARIVLLKDKQLDELRKKNHSDEDEQIVFKEIETALQVAAKERLRLERQLVMSPPINTDKLLNLKKELECINKKNIEKEDELNAVNTQYKEVKDELVHLKDEHSFCSQQEQMIEEKLAEVDDLINQLKVKEEECVALSKSLSNKDKEINMLLKDMKEKEIKCHELIRTNDLLKSNVKILEENLLEIKKQLRAMEKLRNEYNKIESELLDANDRCESMFIKINQLENQIEDMKKKMSNQLKTINSLEVTTSKINKELDVKDHTIEQLKKEIEVLSALHEKTVSLLEVDLKKSNERLEKMKDNEATLLYQLDKTRQKQIAVFTQTMTIDSRSSSAQTEFQDLPKFHLNNSSVDNVFQATPQNKFFTSSVDNVFQSTPQKKIFTSVDNVFEDTPQRKISASSVENVFEDTPRKKISTSSVGSEFGVEDMSIRSDNILELASARINRLAVSDSDVSEFESISVSELKADYENLETDDEDIEEIQKENSHHGNKDETPQEISVLFERYENSPGKNPIKLFVSKYTYDPSIYSPNEDAHLELSIEVGMYLYVYGDMDEDGFYLAELQNGKRGFVPSNLVERVEDDKVTTNGDNSILDEELSEAKSTNQDNIREEDIKDHPIAAEYLSNTNAFKSAAKDTLNQKEEESFLLESDTEDEESDIEEVFVCSPRNVTIERQLNSSVVVSWVGPVDLYGIKGYAIYVNGELKQNVLGSARTKALISDIYPNKIYRISVHTVKSDGTESKDEQAVLTIGKGSAFAPYDLLVKNTTSISCKIMWKPSHSSHYHIVYLDGIDVNKLQPGAYTSYLTNLLPNTEYNVVVESRSMVQKPSPAEWSSSIQFKTLEGYAPEPPLDVQYKLDNKHLQLSWIPVTINDSGTSNGSIVTGYKIYVDGHDVFSVNSPTVDHSELSIMQLFDKKDNVELFVRTQSSGGESDDSNLLRILLSKQEEVSYVQEINTQPIKSFDDDLMDRINQSVLESQVLLDDDDGNLWRQDDKKENMNNYEKEQVVTHYNPENEPSISHKSENKDERIVIGEDDLYIIDEETETDLYSSERTKAERTDTIEFSSETLQDISSDNKIFSTDQSNEQIFLYNTPPIENIAVNNDPSLNNRTIEISDDTLQIETGSHKNGPVKTRSNKSTEINKIIEDSYSLLSDDSREYISKEINKIIEDSCSLLDDRKRDSLSKDIDRLIEEDSSNLLNDQSRGSISIEINKMIEDSYNLLVDETRESSSLTDDIEHITSTISHLDLNQRDVSEDEIIIPVIKIDEVESMNFICDDELIEEMETPLFNEEINEPVNHAPEQSTESRSNEIELSKYLSHGPSDEYIEHDNETRSSEIDLTKYISLGEHVDESSNENLLSELSSMNEHHEHLDEPSNENLLSELSSMNEHHEHLDEPSNENLLSELSSMNEHRENIDEPSNENLLSNLSSMNEHHENIDESSNENLLSELSSMNENSQYSDSIEDSSFKQELSSAYNLQNIAASYDIKPPHQQQQQQQKVLAKSSKLSLHSSTGDSSVEKASSIPRTYSLGDSGKEQPAETYSINKSSIDENHNKTYSFNSYKDKNLAAPNRDIILSSVNIDSYDLIDMLEKDAHRDILDEYPELPLDNTQNIDKIIDEDNDKQVAPTDSHVNSDLKLPELPTDSLDKSNLKLNDPISDNDFSEISIGKYKSNISDLMNLFPDTNDTVVKDIVVKDTIKENDLSKLTTSELSEGEVLSEIDDDSIESGIPLSSLQLSSIMTSQDIDPTNPLSSVNISRTDDSEVDLLLATEIPRIPEIPRDEPIILDHFKNTNIIDDDIVQPVLASSQLQNAPNSAQKLHDDTGINDSLLNQDNTDNKPLSDLKHVIENIETSEDEESFTFSEPAKRSLKFDHIETDSNVKEDKTSIPTELVFTDNKSENVDGDENVSELSESLNIPAPLKNIYNFGDIEISNSEKSITDHAISDDDGDAHSVSDDLGDEHEFDVTPINALDESAESKFSLLEDISSVSIDDDSNELIDTASKKEVATSDVTDNIRDVPSKSKDHIRIFVALYPYNPITMSPNVEYIEDELAFEEGALIKIYGDIDNDGFYYGELDGVKGMIPSNMVSEVQLSDVNQAMAMKNNNSNNLDESRSDVHTKTDSFDVSFMVDKKNIPTDNNLSTSQRSVPSVATSQQSIAPNRGQIPTIIEPKNTLSTKSKSNQNINESEPQEVLNKSLSMPDIYYDNSTSKRLDPYKLHAKRMIALFDYDPTISSPNVDAEIELAFRTGEIIHIYGDMDEDGFFAGKINGRKGLVPSNFVRETGGEKEKTKDLQASAASTSAASPKTKKKTSIFKKSKKIFSKLKGGK